MISVKEARRRLDTVVRPLGEQTVNLAFALGRVLAQPVVADRDFPPTDRSAMDGFAVRHADLAAGSALRVSGEIKAGADPGTFRLGEGEACRIFTGAVIPDGADTVVMVEQTSQDREAGTVIVTEEQRAGRHIRRAAQDLKRGEAVLARGCRIRPAEIAALASVGCTEVPVHRRPRVAVLSTGDELVPPHARPAPYQTRNSNAAMLSAQVREAGYDVEDLGNAPDRRAPLQSKLKVGLDADLLLISGGVSVGEYDLVADELATLGLETLFHGVAMKPGKPILAARSGNRLVLGLPGNPLSTFVGFVLFGRPVLDRMAGVAQAWQRPLSARLAAPLRRKPGRETFHLAILTDDGAGPIARMVQATGSGDVLALARANALVRTPPDCAGLAAAATIEVYPLSRALELDCAAATAGS